MERQCPVCGEPIFDDSLKYCPGCGTELPPDFWEEEEIEEVEPVTYGVVEEEEKIADEGNLGEEMEEETEKEEIEKTGESLEEEMEGEEPEKIEKEEISSEGWGEASVEKAVAAPETGERKAPELPEGSKVKKSEKKGMKKKKGKTRERKKAPKKGEKKGKKKTGKEKKTKEKDKGGKKEGKKKKEEEKSLSRREMQKRRIKEELGERGEKRNIFNYYAINTATTLFFGILAVFTITEFLLLEFNITATAPRVLFNFAPILEPVVGRAGAPILFLVALVLGFDAILHYWDRKRNLQISLLVTLVLIASLLLTLITIQTNSSDMLSLIPALFFVGFVFILDYISILRYPKVLEDPGRDNLEEYLLKEGEIETLLEEEEEKLSLKDRQIEELQQQIDMMGEQIAEEDEKLRMKDEELAQIQSEIQMKEQELLAEEEEIQMKEQELSTVIEQELKKRMEEQMMEEEERLRMKEEELIRAKNELDIQRKLHEEAREKLRMKEQELGTLKSELEKQIRERLEEEEMLKMKEAATRMKEQEKQKRILFPFTALVGQEDMKRALILNAIYPEIGGVLIRGQKGTGKSVSVRGLAEVLPDINVTGCRFNCDPEDIENLCPECRAKYEKGTLESFKRPVRVVDLPLNITEDRLLGSIDIEKILKEGVRSFEPGLLAEAHRGILYVDEINLLDDYIVDLLLDAASSGRVVIEREGISFTHPARFIIVGSMNPEEGELRPQLLDRLALQVGVVGIKDVEKRMEIVRRRKKFTENPQLFREKYERKQEEMRRSITEARERLDSISSPPNILDVIGKLCVEFEVDGHRADIIIERAARANAAFEGRKEVTVEDVIVAATYALPHRAGKRTGEFNREVVEKAIRRLEKEVS